MCDIQSRPAAQSLLFGASSRCLVCQLYASRGGRGSRSQPNYCTCFLVEGRTSSRLRQLFQLSLLEKEAAFPATFPVAAFPAVAGNADFSPPRDVLKGKSEKTKIAWPKNELVRGLVERTFANFCLKVWFHNIIVYTQSSAVLNRC